MTVKKSNAEYVHIFLCKLIFINKTLLIFMTDKNALPVAAS